MSEHLYYPAVRRPMQDVLGCFHTAQRCPVGADRAQGRIEVVGLRHSKFEYFAGAAHSHTMSIAANYLLGALRPLTPESAFRCNNQFITMLSAECRRDRRARLGDNLEEDSLTCGAGPDLADFAVWNARRDGLVIRFGENQVDRYAAEGIRRACAARVRAKVRCAGDQDRRPLSVIAPES